MQCLIVFGNILGIFMQTNGLAMDRDKRKMCAKKTRKDGIYLLVVNVVLHYGKIHEFYAKEHRNFGHMRNEHEM